MSYRLAKRLAYSLQARVWHCVSLSVGISLSKAQELLYGVSHILHLVPSFNLHLLCHSLSSILLLGGFCDISRVVFSLLYHGVHLHSFCILTFLFRSYGQASLCICQDPVSVFLSRL